jgi:hypothetical protein
LIDFSFENKFQAVTHTTIIEGDGVFMAIEILKQLLNDVIKIG